MGPDWIDDHYVLDTADGVFYPNGGGPGLGFSDGAEVEQRLLSWIKATSDRSVLSVPLRAGITDWPSQYHLSPRRANLLRPLQGLLSGRDVLEVGAGCGALTRFLGECGARTLAVEGSPARARIAAARCRSLANVQVVADTLQELPGDLRFDVVTLIGVLEYARVFYPAAKGEDAVDAMLAAAARHLRPGGVLVVAIENQLGLKYFAGYREDHVAQPMFGIEDRYKSDGVVTFGRRELSARLAHAGLGQQNWFYPYPDYKLPNTVLTERAVTASDGVDLAPLLSGSVLADPQFPPRYCFSLEQAWHPVFRNGLAGELANSFLVVASGVPFSLADAATLGWHYSVERRPCFAKATQLIVDAAGVLVRQQRLTDDAPPESIGLAQALVPTGFRHGTLWQMRLNVLLNRPGWTVKQLAEWARVWLDCVHHRTGVPLAFLDAPLGGEWIDAVPRNLVVHDDDFDFIDLEWILEDGPSLGHLCYRALVFSLMSVASVSQPASGVPVRVVELFTAVMQCLGYEVRNSSLHAWHERESGFQCAATGAACWTPLTAIEAYCLPVRAADA